jgi:molybdenum cofactor synthesis domain-containing protein
MELPQGGREASSSPFKRTVALITVSDKGSRGEREDLAGKALSELLEASGLEICFREMVPDERERISRELRRFADDEQVALVVTTGGTGVAPRDVTPDATLAVVERTVPGMAEAMRAASLAKTPHAMLSRAVVGIRCRTLIVNLPGSPRGALENLEVLLPALPHALDKIQGDPSECAQSESAATCTP